VDERLYPMWRLLLVTGLRRGELCGLRCGDHEPLQGTLTVRRPAGGERPRTRPDLVPADKADASKGNRAHLRSRGIKACIASKTGKEAHRKARGSKRGHPPGFDPILYTPRHPVERGINRQH
jgi:integrase